MKKRYSHLIKPIALILDILTLNISILISYYIKFNEFLGLLEPPYFRILCILNLSWILILFSYKKLDSSRVNFKIDVLMTNYLRLTIILITVTLLFWVITKGYLYSRVFAIVLFLIHILLGLAWRILGIYFFREYRNRGYNLRYFAIIGSNSSTETLINFFDNQIELGYIFHKQYSNLNELPELLHLIKLSEIDTVYIDINLTKHKDLLSFIKETEVLPVEVKIIPEFGGYLFKGIRLDYEGYLPILTITKNPFSRTRNRIIKRIFDIAFSITALILLVPFFILFGILTKLSSKGPAIFLSERVGQWGNKFSMFKFRSMYIDADEIARKELKGKMHSIGKNDPRITRVGHFIRKTRIDELPQFLNVLKGEMSIVGPRPLAQYDVDLMMKLYPYDFQRLLTLKPGLTSLGQIYFGYAVNEQENKERLKYDMLYLKKYSILLDIKLSFLTILIMLKGKGQ